MSIKNKKSFRKYKLRENKNKNKNKNKKSMKNQKKNMKGEKKDSNKKNIVKSLPDNKGTKLSDEIKNCDISVIKFYSDTCPHCIIMSGEWNKFGEMHKNSKNKNNKNVGVFEVEINKYKFDDSEKEKYKIIGVPHIIKVNNNGDELGVFNDQRNTEKLIIFLNN